MLLPNYFFRKLLLGAFVCCCVTACKTDDRFTPITGGNPNDRAPSAHGSLIGTWYLEKRFMEDGTEHILGDCDKERKATYKANGTCSHERYTTTENGCALSDAYSCRYSFELGIITSTSVEYGTVKSIVKFPDANTLAVFNNLGDKVAEYSRVK
ncbi:lipocalin family protein [Maribacter sp. 2-571]|uniref:lipocalin family protein n=1 Tax=Maribacter sp. 2-571 TaxID=3417569 RepID=UPI003D32566F